MAEDTKLESTEVKSIGNVIIPVKLSWILGVGLLLISGGGLGSLALPDRQVDIPVEFTDAQTKVYADLTEAVATLQEAFISLNRDYTKLDEATARHAVAIDSIGDANREGFSNLQDQFSGFKQKADVIQSKTDLIIELLKEK